MFSHGWRVTQYLMSIHASALAASGPLVSIIKPSVVRVWSLWCPVPVCASQSHDRNWQSCSEFRITRCPSIIASRAWKGCNSPDRKKHGGGWRSIGDQDVACVVYSDDQICSATTTASTPVPGFWGCQNIWVVR